MEVDKDEPHDCPDREDIEDKDGNSYLTGHPSGDSNSISSNYNSSSSSYYDQKRSIMQILQQANQVVINQFGEFYICYLTK